MGKGDKKTAIDHYSTLVDDCQVPSFFIEWETDANINNSSARNLAEINGFIEYVRGNSHTNTIEGFFSIFKRGMKGVYQHCKSNHLQRYLYEFDFRYNTKDIADIERVSNIVAGFIGKRLTYKTSS